MHWSIGLLVSIALCPVVLYYLMRFIGAPAAWIFLGFCCLAFLYLQYQQRDTLRQRVTKSLRLGPIAIFAVFYLLACILLIDFQIDGRLIRPLMSFDFVKHVAVTDAISRTGIIPVNPSFHPGEPLPLFYYYFWFLLCSMVDLLGGSYIGPRGAVLASIIWSGIALFYLVKFYANRLGHRIVRGLEGKHLIFGYVLLLVTGLDILPIVFELVNPVYTPEGRVFPDVLWWNDQVESWVSSVLWTPHHVGGFIACMIALYLVIEQKPLQTRKGKVAIVLIAATFVSALGMSIWATLVAGLFMIFWLLTTLRAGWRQESLFLVLTGSLSIILALPYVIDLYEANHFFRPSIIFQVREFTPLGTLFNGLSPILVNLVRLLVLPLNYLLEFGFFAIGGLIYWGYRRSFPDKLERTELFSLLLMATSFFVCTFFRSALFNNDLGWRGFLFAQFILLFYSMPLLASLSNSFSQERFTLTPTIRKLAILALVLSTFMILFQSYMMRNYFWGPDHKLTISLREAYEWQDENLPIAAVMQHYPDIELYPGDQAEYFHALYGNRQVLIADRLYARAYGINDVMFDSTFVKVNRFFLPGLSSEEGLQLSSHLNIDGFFLKHTDPIWNDANSWLAPYEPVYESICCRIYLTETMK
ncbi:MAG: hypothetical protein AB8G77_21915 [Rhodothermales bacterium]